MRAVRQTVFGKGDGNCFPACIASILECDIDEVPNFCSESEPDKGSTWLEKTAAWLKTKGKSLIYFKFDEGRSVPLIFPGVYVIISGRSPRAMEGDDDFMHAVIAVPELGERTEVELHDGSKCWNYQDYQFRYVHDPHHSDAFIAGDPMDLFVIV
jgi:hypothetical protein